MSTMAPEGTSAFASNRTGTVTTITSDHTSKRANKHSRYSSLLQLRHGQHETISSDDDLSSGCASASSSGLSHRQSRLFQNGLKLLDHRLWSEPRHQLTTGRSPGIPHSQSPGAKRSMSPQASTTSVSSTSQDNTSSGAGSTSSSSTCVPLTKDEFESLPPTIQRKWHYPQKIVKGCSETVQR
ncbi:hypothetical protein K4F52_008942 [Lecanicillium sp. MT-2017a]|nr:hypothetical protein K4F52_008942 [Lecanicillium sp. MT-2017a]